MNRSGMHVLRCVLIVLATAGPLQAAAGEAHIYVDGSRGRDTSRGARTAPVKTIAGALRRLPKPLNRSATIHLAPGKYDTFGAKARDNVPLELSRRMPLGVRVRIVGTTADFAKPAQPGGVVLNWTARNNNSLVMVTNGRWTLENIQVGSRRPGQARGISVAGPALLELRNVRIRTASQASPALRAHHGGRIQLYGAIEINEDLHESPGRGDTFACIEAEYFGVIRFRQRKGASLSIGNGNLSAKYYGVIELGCERARITSWAYQSNPIAINNSGRIDLHNTTTVLCARDSRNTPIGLEDDGHVLAEGARITILGCDNENAIVLQKASAFFCNDVEIKGPVRQPLLTYSGSTLLVGIVGDLGAVRATTGSTIIIEKCTGRLAGPVQADKLGRVVMPDGKTVQAATQLAGGLDPADLPELHAAAYGGYLAIATRLIERGADVNAKGPNGWTPLHLAAMGGHRKLAEMLLARGAHLAARDDTGNTAANLAASHGHSGMTAFLRKSQSQATE